ncbi:MAG: OmpH family outer membrane protein [Cyclobacteriaceae bacterium]|nr:OmpH family outer membrane protein [Cyclobacteriaceae bacterium]
MKNISLALNIVLLVAVGVLYFLFFSSRSGSGNSSGSQAGQSSLSVAYINSDSVLKHYEYIKASAEILEAKKKKVEQDYRNRAESLQGEITAYQRNMNNMTIGQVRTLEEDLARKQQNLQLFEQRITQELVNDQAKLNEELYKRVTAFLKKYGEEKGLQMVFKLDPGSDILYGQGALDITNEVIAGLNQEYRAEKEATKKN